MSEREALSQTQGDGSPRLQLPLPERQSLEDFCEEVLRVALQRGVSCEERLVQLASLSLAYASALHGELSRGPGWDSTRDPSELPSILEVVLGDSLDDTK